MRESYEFSGYLIDGNLNKDVEEMQYELLVVIFLDLCSE